MFAKVTELKGRITPCLRFMTFGDNFYEADDGWTEFMIAQNQKYQVNWIIGAPQGKQNTGGIFPFFLQKVISILIWFENDLEYSAHVKEIRVREGTYVESHTGKTENQECK